MLMSALFAAGAFALNGNVAKADNVQAVNNNNANSTEVKQNTVNADSSKLNVASAQIQNDQANNQEESTKSESNKDLTQDSNEFNIAAVKHYFGEFANIQVPNEDELDKEVSNLYKKRSAQQDENGRDTTSAYESPFVYMGYVDISAVNPEKLTNPNSEKLNDKDVDWNKIDSQLKNAKEKVDNYLDSALNENTSYLPTAKKNAGDSIKAIAIPTETEVHSNYINDLDTLKGIYQTISLPYLATLFDFRGNEGEYLSAIGNSDYKDQSTDYVNKLAELVARNVHKDKDWVLFNTNPFVPTAAAYPVNTELIKLDRDAYNRNNDIKSDENTSDNKNQSTTDTKKDQASQNVTDNTSTKKNQSSEKVTNDTTSKKDQSTTSTSSSNTNQTTASNSSTTSSKTTSDTKTPVAKNEGSNTKTTNVVKSENKATENTASVVKTDTKAAAEKTNDVKVVSPAKNASNEVKTTDAATKASDAHVVALNSKVNAGTTSTTPAAAAKGSQAKAAENKLPQAGTDEKISLFASLAGLSIVSLGLGALGASKKRKND